MFPSCYIGLRQYYQNLSRVCIYICIYIYIYIYEKKIILSFVWEGKGTKIARTILKNNNKVEGISKSGFKIYYNMIVIKTVILADGYIYRSME